MKNILIVDDEPLIANGVTQLVSRFDLPLNIAGTVTDSEEALALCQREKIDIVITDINMPKLNGIQLIKALKAVNSSLQIIILTGFGSFEYAKEAMALGVKHFLEKPVVPARMEEAIATSITTSQRREVESRLYQRRQIERFITSSGEESLPAELQYPFCLYLFDSKFYGPITQLLAAYPDRSRLISGHHNKVGYIVNNSQEDTFNHFFRDQLATAPLGKGIAVDCTINNANDFLLNFHLGKRNLDKEFYFDAFHLIHEKQILKEKVYENRIYTEFREKLLQYLLQGELTRAQLLVENFFATCREELYPVQLLRLQVNELLSTIFELHPVKKDDLFEDYSPKIMLLNDWRELQFMLIHCIDLMRDTLANTENMKLSQKVNLIIEEYYDREALSLKWIATRLLYLNPEYLGKTYYKEAGVRFNKKLAEYRIEKAKELLQKNYKVYEVASLTGFGNSPEYFVQTFKKIAGLTPKQFIKNKEQVNS